MRGKPAEDFVPGVGLTAWDRAIANNSRPIAAPLPVVAEILGQPLAAVEAAAALVEPYRHANGSPRWSVELVVVQLGVRAGHCRGGGRERRRNHQRRRRPETVIRTVGLDVVLAVPATTVRTVGLDAVLDGEARRRSGGPRSAANASA